MERIVVNVFVARNYIQSTATGRDPFKFLQKFRNSGLLVFAQINPHRLQLKVIFLIVDHKINLSR